MFDAEYILGVAALVVFQVPLVSSDQNCSVVHWKDSFMYELSEPHDPTCETSWEDITKTVLARDSEINETLVVALTNRSIILKRCHDYLRYREECSGVQVTTDCSVNCTHLLAQSPNTTGVNSTVIHTTGDVKSSLGVIGGIAVGFAVCAVGVALCVNKHRARRNAEKISYSASSSQVKMELESNLRPV